MRSTKLFTLAFLAVFALLLAGCGGGGGGGGVDTPTSDSNVAFSAALTATEEAEYSEDFTKMGVSYYGLVTKFNQVAFSNVTDQASYDAWSTALDEALVQAQLAEDQNAKVAAYPVAQETLTGATVAGVGSNRKVFSAVSSNSDSARKLLNLYLSGNGPERLTIAYIAEKTGKSVAYLKALLQTVVASREAEIAEDDAVKFDRAAKSCEFLRDAAITVNSAIAMAATGPIASAGALTKALQGTSSVKKIWAGTKVVYEVYTATKLLDNIANQSARLVIGIGTGDVPPRIPTITGTILKKTGLEKLDTVVSLVTGIQGVLAGNTNFNAKWAERINLVTDLYHSGTSLFQRDDDPLKVAHFSADSQLVDTVETDIVSTASQNDHNAAQTTGRGSMVGSYLENIKLSSVAGDTSAEATNSDTFMGFLYEATTDKTTVLWDGDGDDFADFNFEMDGKPDVKDDAGDFATYGALGVDIAKKTETIVVTQPTDSNYDAQSIYNRSWANSSAIVPVPLENLSGDLDGTYVCSGDAAGNCGFSITGPRIKGWMQRNAEEPLMEFDGLINTADGWFEAYGAIPSDKDYQTYYGVNFEISGYISATMDYISYSSVMGLNEAGGTVYSEGGGPFDWIDIAKR